MLQTIKKSIRNSWTPNCPNQVKSQFFVSYKDLPEGLTWNDFGWIGRGSSELVLFRQLLLEGKEVTHLCLNVEQQHRVSLYMPKCVYVYRVRGGAIMLCKSFGCFHFWRPAWGACAARLLPPMLLLCSCMWLVTKPWLNQKYVGLS